MNLRRLRYALEGALLRLTLALFGALPVDTASRLGGALARLIGPRLGVSRIARNNLRLALPELDAKAREEVVKGMWDNLGRTLAEYPHLDYLYSSGRVEIVGVDNILQLRDDGIGGIFFSAHYGNWELLSLSVDRHGIAPVLIYRPANNPWSERQIQDLRLRAHRTPGAEYLPKSGEGLRLLVRALRGGRHLAMLVDQKMNRGIPLPFFGHTAMTAPVIAQLALKYRVPVVPARIERLEGARFRMSLYAPMELPDSGDQEADVVTLMSQINSLFEQWIRERPDHWLWIHRRWPKG